MSEVDIHSHWVGRILQDTSQYWTMLQRRNPHRCLPFPHIMELEQSIYGVGALDILLDR